MEQGKKKEMKGDKLVVEGGVVISQPKLFTSSLVGARVRWRGNLHRAGRRLVLTGTRSLEQAPRGTCRAHYCCDWCSVRAEAEARDAEAGANCRDLPIKFSLRTFLTINRIFSFIFNKIL